MNNELKDALQAVKELKKEAFAPMPQGGPPQGGPPPGPPQGGPPPGPPQGGPPPGPPQGGPPPGPPQGGGSVLQILQQNGIDPNQVLQDQNLLAQIAQQAGMPPEQLAQMIQAEMQGGGGGPPPPGGPPPGPEQGGPPPGPEQGGPPQGPDPVEELFGTIQQMIPALQEAQQSAQFATQRLDNVEGQLQALAKEVEKINALTDQPGAMPENVA